MKIRLKFEPRDLWVGLFWTRSGVFYVCLVPMFPIKVVLK